MKHDSILVKEGTQMNVTEETVPKSVRSENHILLRSTWKSKKDRSSVVGLEKFPAISSNVTFAAGTDR